MRRAAGLLMSSVLGVVLCGCGVQASTTAGTPAPVPPAAAAPAEADGAEPTGCPLSAAELSSTTGMTFELRTTEADRKLETLPSVTALVCVFTSSDRPQMGGDPLVLRVDTVTGPNAATVRSEFEKSCTRNGGTLGDSEVAGGKTCTSRGSTTEGNVISGDRTVSVYFVLADSETAADLTPAFDGILRAVA
jgi:hypothetical protein